MHWTRQETEDVVKGNNRWLRTEFPTRAPGLDWDAFFAAAQLPAGQPDLIVWQPSAITGIANLVASQPLSTWRDYLLVRALESRAAVLPRAVATEHFAFHERTLHGAPALRARWKLAVEATNAALGDAVGKLYVEAHFTATAKSNITSLVERLRAAFARRIDALDWMSPDTKANAKMKLAALRVGVGYPDTWQTYGGLRVVRGDAFGNAERASLFEYHRELAKLGRTVDRSEWVMTPQTVNAVNLPVMNALIFPAAVLQPPFFDPNGDPAANFGAIGTIIGHEISHSFDDQGANFDAAGRLRDWWTAEDRAQFAAAGDRLVRQFDAYRPFPDLAVNGRQTLSENIADVAGLVSAFDAYRLEVDERPVDIRQGFTGEQRLFLCFAQNWRMKFREADLRLRIATDGHAPAEYRASTVRNVSGWYSSFNVRPDEALYLAPADRVPVW